ncbi:MAG: outer membrane beta-barrel protein, partial [Gemmatimonadales bacterium]
MTFAFAACLAAPARAQRLYRAEVSAAGVYNLFDKSATDLKGSLGVAGRAGYWITSYLGVEGEAAFTHTGTASADSGISVRSFAGSVLWNFALGLKHSAF